MLSEVETFLKSLNGTRVIYIPNRGNAGDSFIAHATYQLFDRMNLDYEIGSQQGNYPGATLICAGGGNLIRPYTNMISFLKRNLNTWRQLVILPHSVRDYADTLGQLGANSFVFCREQPSFEFMKKAAPKANIFLSHDLAFGCNFFETKRQIALRPAGDIFNKVILSRNAKRLVRAIYYSVANIRDPQVLNAVRTDIEKTDFQIPFPNIDLSQAFAADDMGPVSSLHATYWLMRFINRFQVIVTNRLHIGIMSAMLGREVSFYDNSYGKNRDVFTHSLARFKNVEWHTNLPS